MTQRTWTALLLFSALALRVGFLFSLPDQLDLVHYGDQGTFDQLATSLVEKKTFGWEGRPNAARSPAYPFFLAACYLLFGKSLRAVRLVQALLGTLTVLLIYLWARDWFTETAARWAGGIAAVYPFYIFYTGYMLQETLLVFCSVLALYLLHNLQKRNSPSLAFSSGMTLGLLILTKASLLPFAILSLLLVAARRKGGVAACLGFSLCLLPWLSRNTLLLGQPVLDTHGGITAFEGIVYYRFNKAGRGGDAIRASDFWPEVSRMDELGQDRFFKGRVKEFVLSHPAAYLKQISWNFLDFWRLYPRLDISFVHPTYKLAAVSLLFELPLMLLSVWSLWGLRSRWREWLLPILLVGPLTLAHCLIIAQMRYRLPAMAVLIVLAGWTLADRKRNAA